MIGLLFLFAACQEKVTSPARVDTLPSIFPDYVGVTIPSTIAPLNFRVTDDGVEAVDVVIAGTKGKPVRLNGRSVDIPAKQWHELLESNKGDSIEVKVSVRQGKKWKEYRPFPIYVSPFPIDYGLVYRLLAPGYEVYSKMGIYERELSTFRQTPLFENTQVTAACINCHAFNRTEPTPSSVHVRGGHGATVIDTGDRLEFLDTKADGQLSACVYPYWHPSGEYIAYSVNRYIGRALELFPGQVDFHLSKGHTLNYSKQYPQAIKAYKQSLGYARTDSLRSVIWGFIGDTWHQKATAGKQDIDDDFARAVRKGSFRADMKQCYKAYDHSLRYDPDNAMVLNNYAYFLSLEGRELEKALTMSSRAIALTDNNPTYLDTHAWVLFKLGRTAEAKKVMQQAIALDGQESAALLVHYGDILHAMGEQFMAEIYWRKGLEKGYDADQITRRMEQGKAEKE